MSDIYTRISEATGVPRMDVKKVILAYTYQNTAGVSEQNKWIVGKIIDIKPERVQ